jgi:hypothetical protein
MIKLFFSSAKVYPFFGTAKDFLLRFLKDSQKVIYKKRVPDWTPFAVADSSSIVLFPSAC